MPDHSTHFKPLDPGRIDIIDRKELTYWSKEFGCTESELAQAVTQVGEHVTAVREYLASRQQAKGKRSQARALGTAGMHQQKKAG